MMLNLQTSLAPSIQHVRRNLSPPGEFNKAGDFYYAIE